MKILEKHSIFLDKKLTKVILSGDLMERSSPLGKRAGLKVRIVDLPVSYSHHFTSPALFLNAANVHINEKSANPINRTVVRSKKEESHA